MNDDGTPSQAAKSWLERLHQLLQREPETKDELLTIIKEAATRNLLNTDAQAMIEGVLQVAELQARDIMIPRSQMIAIDESKAPDLFLPTIIASGHSRFPVISEHDKATGIIHAKDLLRFSTNNYEDFQLRDILRPVNFVPESRRLDKLLKDFRVTRNHMAVVVDEYGEITGIVTIEDIIEQIIGEIEDEFDAADQAYIKKHKENEFIVKALIPIEEFNEYFQTEFSDEEYDTLGGLVSKAFGRVPKKDEVITLGRFSIKIINADTRHIRLLQITLPPKSE